MATETAPAPATGPSDVDAGVIEDARRRQRKQRRLGGAVLLAALAAGVSVIALGGGGNGASSDVRGQARRPSHPSATNASQRPVVLLRTVDAIQAYAAAGQLYLFESPNSDPGSEYVVKLVHMSALSRRVLAVRELGSAYGTALLADHVLWLTTYRSSREWLWRLDPRTLAVLSKTPLPEKPTGEPLAGGAFSSLATAGGWLWVGYTRGLDRVSLSNARVSKVIAIKGGLEIASNPSGSVLADSEGWVYARIQLRDPVSGRLLKQTSLIEGVSRPRIGGVFAGGIWVSQSTGLAGGFGRLSLRTLKPTRVNFKTPLNFSNGVTTDVEDGILWITQTGGDKQQNFCVSPAGGDESALPLGPTATVLAETGRTYFYVVDTPKGEDLDEATVATRC